MSGPLLRAALAYVENGYRVLPLKPGTKAPASAHGLRDATCDPEQVRRWFGSGHANLGLLPPEGVLVMDCDSAEAAERLLADCPELRDAPRCQSPRGGAHIYTRLPEGAPAPKTATGVLPEMDLRGCGRAYLVAPPSRVHGRAYVWRRPLLPPDGLPPIPLSLYERLTPKPAPRHTPTGASHPTAYGKVALEREVAAVASAQPGGRNQRLNRATFSLGGLVAVGVLDQDEVADELLWAAAACGLPASEARRTLGSALKAGMDKPRELPRGTRT